MRIALFALALAGLPGCQQGVVEPLTPEGVTLTAAYADSGRVNYTFTNHSPYLLRRPWSCWPNIERLVGDEWRDGNPERVCALYGGVLPIPPGTVISGTEQFSQENGFPRLDPDPGVYRLVAGVLLPDETPDDRGVLVFSNSFVVE